MTEIRFYHLLTTPLERALPQLLEKLLARRLRAVVIAGSPERVEALDNALWTYHPQSFLPHGSVRDGFAEEQPVWLTDADENPNRASVLILTDGAESARVEEYNTCLEVFDGKDERAVEAARRRWLAYRESGHSLSYFQQNATGGWERRE